MTHEFTDLLLGWYFNYSIH